MSKERQISVATKKDVGLPTRKGICSERRTAPKSNNSPHFPTHMPYLSDNRQWSREKENIRKQLRATEEKRRPNHGPSRRFRREKIYQAAGIKRKRFVVTQTPKERNSINGRRDKEKIRRDSKYSARKLEQAEEKLQEGARADWRERRNAEENRMLARRENKNRKPISVVGRSQSHADAKAAARPASQTDQRGNEHHEVSGIRKSKESHLVIREELAAPSLGPPKWQIGTQNSHRFSEPKLLTCTTSRGQRQSITDSSPASTRARQFQNGHFSVFHNF